MFNIKSFVSLVFAAVFAVLFMQASLTHANEPEPAIASAQQVNINTADAEAIASTLKGVGMKKAQAIINYRETYGPFHDIEELTEVKGIGQATLNKNNGLIVVE